MRGLSATSLPRAGQHHLPEPYRDKLTALPENTYQKASNFTGAPREEKHLPRQVSSQSTFLPVLHRKPLSQGAPHAQPLAPPPGRAGRGNHDFKGH